MGEKGKSRLDQLLVERGVVESRQKARGLIMAGLVRVNGQREDKPGKRISPNALLKIESPPLYVSRGGLKLEAALRRFQIDVTGLILLT